MDKIKLEEELAACAKELEKIDRALRNECRHLIRIKRLDTNIAAQLQTKMFAAANRIGEASLIALAEANSIGSSDALGFTDKPFTH